MTIHKKYITWNPIMITLVTLLLTAKVSSQAEEDPVPEQEEINVDFWHYEYGQYVFLLGCLIIVITIRHLIKTFEIPIPHSVFCIIVGTVWGIMAIKIKWLKPTLNIFELATVQAREVYLPPVIFGTTFCIDVHAFLKSLPQILIISVPLLVINSVMCGILMGFVINSEWRIIDGIFFGVMLNTIYPLDIMHFLKETSQTKQVVVLLEGETIVSTVVVLYTYNIIKYTIEGWVVYWYHYVMGVIRLLLIGIPASYLLGIYGAFLLRISYNDTLSLSLITVVMCFASYVFIKALSQTGSIGALITGMMLGIERTSLPGETEKAITDIWKIITTLMNGMLFLIIGAMTPSQIEDEGDIRFDAYALVFVTYLISNIGRFISFFVFSPILSRIGYGMTFKSMVICVWGGLKHPITLSLAVQVTEVYTTDPHKANHFYLHSIFVYLLYLFINASFFPVILKALGLTELSVSRQINMNNCVKYILQARERTIAILKMDRFLSDANWPLVMTATFFKHPYRKKTAVTMTTEEESDDEDEIFITNRYSVCPDCKKRIPTEPTQRELKEMTKEAKMRLLKLRKIFYSRRYENGMITKDGSRMAQQSVEVAMESEQRQIEIGGLIKLFNKENMFCRFLQNRVMYLLKTNIEDLQPPKRRFRLICHRVVQHLIFRIFLYVINLGNVTMGIYGINGSIELLSMEYHIYNYFNTLLFFCYFISMWIVVLSYSRISIFKQGIPRYFRSLWNIFNFILMCICFIDTIRYFVVWNNEEYVNSLFNVHLLNTIVILRLFAVFYFLQLIKHYKNFGTNVVKFLDVKIDKFRIMAFELAKNFISTEEEVLENINSVVDNNRIRVAIKEKIDSDRLEVTRAFGMAQKDRPWVAVTIKTKLSIMTVLKSMKDDIQQLKLAGWVDDIEFSKLNKSLAERYKFLTSIKTVEQSSPTNIFKEVSWMGNDTKLIDYLYENTATKKFDPGDTICREGEMIEGIYIVVSGVFVLTYTPQKQVLDKLNEAGILPISDFMSPTNFETNTKEYIIPGNTIGELCILTERPYNCVITAETHSQVFVLRRDIIKQAMEMDPDPVNGLESRIWKRIGFRVAIPLLINVPSYRSCTLENIAITLERSFMPNISNYKVFIVNEMMEDILLIEGVAVDLNTRDVYTGPCYIQRSVQKLILPKSSSLNMEVEVETKLIIIPAKDFDEYEIMMNEEKICDLVSYSSSRCLQHLIQDRITKTKSGKTKKKVLRQVNIQEKVDEESRSKITFEQSI